MSELPHIYAPHTAICMSTSSTLYPSTLKVDTMYLPMPRADTLSRCLKSQWKTMPSLEVLTGRPSQGERTLPFHINHILVRVLSLYENVDL